MIITMKQQLHKLNQNASRFLFGGAQSDVAARSDNGDLPRFGGV